MQVKTFPPAGGVESQVVAPDVPLSVHTTAPYGVGPLGDGLIVAVIVKVSPKFGAAGVLEKLIVGVAGPTVTLAGGALCATAK
jgi:hypothetical protein